MIHGSHPYSVYTVFLSPLATSFPFTSLLRKGLQDSLKLSSGKDHKISQGGRNCYFSISDWSFSTFPGKQSPVTNPESGNWVSTIWKRGTKEEFWREEIIALAITQSTQPNTLSADRMAHQVSRNEVLVPPTWIKAVAFYLAFPIPG